MPDGPIVVSNHLPSEPRLMSRAGLGVVRRGGDANGCPVMGGGRVDFMSGPF